LGLEYEHIFTTAVSTLKSFDSVVYNSYFTAMMSSSATANEKCAHAYDLIRNHHKYLDYKCLVMYYDLIFRTNKLPVEKVE
jgi:hypothetical protein